MPKFAPIPIERCVKISNACTQINQNVQEFAKYRAEIVARFDVGSRTDVELKEWVAGNYYKTVTRTPSSRKSSNGKTYGYVVYGLKPGKKYVATAYGRRNDYPSFGSTVAFTVSRQAPVYYGWAISYHKQIN